MAQKARPKKVTKMRVFVASPSDVAEERQLLSKVIDEFNRVMGLDRNIVLELVRWETHVAPDMGRPQDVINRQIGPYDVFVGIMWKRFGTPTGKADSGTLEEFGAAYESWRVAGKPRIMFYFKQAPYTLRTPAEADQVRQVLEFRSQLSTKALFWDYQTSSEFEDCVREHLTRSISELVNSNTTNRRVGTENRALLVKEPVQELFDTAFAEWKKHQVYASRDRLELFLANKERLELTPEHLRFVIESWCKTREYSIQKYLTSYDKEAVTKICRNIITRERDVDLLNGAIRMIGTSNSIAEADLLLGAIKAGGGFDDRNREVAVDQFWLSPIREVKHVRITDVLIDVLLGDDNYKLRKEAAYALRYHPSERVVSALESALNDSRSAVRYVAVDVLGSLAESSSVDPLIRLLNVEYSARMRKRIVWTLGSFKSDVRVRQVLESIVMKDDEDPQVAQEAYFSLERINSLTPS